MRIYAHRGVSAHYPENSLAAFARAVGLRTHGVELDVRLSGDGVAVVHHDPTVNRTTNGIGDVADFTAKQLGLLDVGHRQHVPTLAQVLALSAGKVRVNIDIKEAAVVLPLLEVTQQFADLNWFASCEDWRTLQALREASPSSDCYPVTRGIRSEDNSQLSLEEAVDLAGAWGSTGISVWEGGLNRSAVELIHSRKLEVWSWTVNDQDRARELHGMGVDAVCTDDPELIRAGLYENVVAG